MVAVELFCVVVVLDVVGEVYLGELCVNFFEVLFVVFDLCYCVFGRGVWLYCDLGCVEFV